MKTGDKVIVKAPIFNKRGHMVASIGQKGTIISKGIDDNGEVHLKLNTKHYPINYAPAKCLELLNN